MEEPNVDEREWVMGFHTNIIIMFGLSKRIVGKFWGKSWI
jgi:hypothetical protein